MPDPLIEAGALLEAAVGLHQAGKLAEAEAGYRRALALDPANPDALNLLGVIHQSRGEAETAIRLIRAAIAIHPAGRYFYNLGVAHEGLGDVPSCVAAFRQSALRDPGDPSGWTSAIFNGDLHPYGTPAVRLSDRRAFNAANCAGLTAAAAPHPNDAHPDRRLRIGYLSADFTDHSAAMVFGPVLDGHHREQVEVTCYWQQRTPADQDTARFRQIADRWRVVNELDDDALAALIRADEIDILVDLSGYSNGNRLTMLARKPAPIIMTGWGHVTGLGIDAADYILADAITVPVEHRFHHHERVIHLPCALAFDPKPPYPDVAPAPAERAGVVTFGYLGRALKTNETVWATWAEILHRVPRSRLLFKSREYADPAYRTRLLEFFASLLIDSRRLEFRGQTGRQEHLAAYGGIDVALDPFPHGGGVTVLESCLMGVPTVTLLGDHLNGRIGASVLATIGRGQFVAADAENYVEIAARLGQTAVTHEARKSIRSALLGSIICDPDRYAAAVEDQYRAAWRAWCQSRQPVARPALSLVTA